MRTDPRCCLDAADSGGAAEETGPGGGRCVCRCAESPEHLQQALLQVRISAMQLINNAEKPPDTESLICICHLHLCFVLSHSAVKVDFFSISYRQLEKQV